MQERREGRAQTPSGRKHSSPSFPHSQSCKPTSSPGDVPATAGLKPPPSRSAQLCPFPKATAHIHPPAGWLLMSREPGFASGFFAKGGASAQCKTGMLCLEMQSDTPQRSGGCREMSQWAARLFWTLARQLCFLTRLLFTFSKLLLIPCNPLLLLSIWRSQNKTDSH